MEQILADKQEAMIKEAFQECDSGCDQRVWHDQLIELLDKLGQTPDAKQLQEYAAYFKRINQDFISYADFRKMVIDNDLLNTEAQIQLQYDDMKIFDIQEASKRSEKPGHIRLSDLKHMLSSVGYKISPIDVQGQNKPRGNPHDIEDFVGQMRVVDGEYVKYEEVLRYVGSK